MWLPAPLWGARGAKAGTGDGKTGEAQAFLQLEGDADAHRARTRPAPAHPQPGRNTADLVSAEMLLAQRGEASGVVLADPAQPSHMPRGTSGWVLKALAEARSMQMQAAARPIKQPRRRCRPAGATEPRRQELFRRLNLAPGGTFALVRMREELLDRKPIGSGGRGSRFRSPSGVLFNRGSLD